MTPLFCFFLHRLGSSSDPACAHPNHRFQAGKVGLLIYAPLDSKEVVWPHLVMHVGRKHFSRARLAPARTLSHRLPIDRFSRELLSFGQQWSLMVPVDGRVQNIAVPMQARWEGESAELSAVLPEHCSMENKVWRANGLLRSAPPGSDREGSQMEDQLGRREECLDRVPGRKRMRMEKVRFSLGAPPPGFGRLSHGNRICT